MAITTTTRPVWVLPGEQWTPGQTQQQYEEMGGKLAPGVASILQIPTVTPPPAPTVAPVIPQAPNITPEMLPHTVATTTPKAPTTATTPTGTTATAPTGTTATYPTANLQPGMSGDEVKKLQDYLVSQKYMTQDQVNTGYGIYGPQTTAAVKALQQKMGIDSSTGPGYFGPRTIAALKGGIADGAEAMAEQTAQATEEQKYKTRQEIYDQYGIDTLEKNWEASPTRSYEDVYKEIYNTLNLSEVKTKIDDAIAKIDKAEKDMNDAIGNIRENPWLDEASKVGRANRVQDKAQAELTRLQNNLTLLTNAYNSGKEEAENTATRAINTYQQNKTYLKEELDYYTKRAQSDLDAQTAEIEGENKYRYQNIKEVDGGLYDMDTNQWIVKPKAEKTSLTDLLKLQELATTANAAKSDALDSYSLVDTLMSSNAFAQLTGKAQIGGVPVLGNLLAGADTKLAMNQLLQLRGILSLENRSKLKGQGQISDFEGKMLANAASALGITDKGTTNLSEEELRRQLAIVKGAFANSAGMEATVKVTSPTGETIHATASREEIDNLILEGNTVTYE